MLLLFVDFLLDEILEVHLGHVFTIAELIVVVDKYIAVAALAAAATFVCFLAT